MICLPRVCVCVFSRGETSIQFKSTLTRQRHLIAPHRESITALQQIHCQSIKTRINISHQCSLCAVRSLPLRVCGSVCVYVGICKFDGFMWVCVYLCESMWIYKGLCVSICIYMYLCVRLCGSMCIYMGLCGSLCIYMSLCGSMCI